MRNIFWKEELSEDNRNIKKRKTEKRRGRSCFAFDEPSLLVYCCTSRFHLRAGSPLCWDTLRSRYQFCSRLRNECTFRPKYAYPCKDAEDRLLTESSCIQFIFTRIGGWCDEGVDFLWLCSKQNLAKAQHCEDMLAIQRARWTGRSLSRGIFCQSHPSHCSPSQSSGGGGVYNVKKDLTLT